MSGRLLYHLKQWGWIVLETILYIILMLSIGGALTALLTVVVPESLDIVSSSDISDPYMEMLVGFLPMLIGSLAALYIVHVLIFKRALRLTGFIKEGILSGTWRGAWIAFLMLALGFVLLWIFGGLRIDNIDFDGYLLVGFLVFFFIQSSFEEVVSRAFLIPTIERRSNVWAAVLVSSLLFSLVHGGNPNVSTIALINIFLAGLLMGVLFVRYRSIWPAIGLHVFWNFLQGSFFGFEVSGHEVYSLINTTETGLDIITGGAFGYEGSLLGALSLAIATFLVWRSKPAAFNPLVEYTSLSTDSELPLQELLTDTDGGNYTTNQ